MLSARSALSTAAGAPDAYVRTVDEICAKIDETIALGGTGVLMQGGLHPDFGTSGMKISCAPCTRSIKLSAALFFATEIHNIHLISGTGLRDHHGASERRWSL